MARPSRTSDLRRLGEIADSLEVVDALYNERVLILKRRQDAGDVSLADLARAARISPAQVRKSLIDRRVERARVGGRSPTGH